MTKHVGVLKDMEVEQVRSKIKQIVKEVIKMLMKVNVGTVPPAPENKKYVDVFYMYNIAAIAYKFNGLFEPCPYTECGGRDSDAIACMIEHGRCNGMFETVTGESPKWKRGV